MNSKQSVIIALILLLVALSPSDLVLAQLFEGQECQTHNGKPGHCREDKQCQWLIDEIYSGRMVFSDIVRCSFKRNSLVACCMDDPSPAVPQTTVPPPASRIGGQKANVACLGYAKWAVPFYTDSIIGGTAAQLGEFPHMVAILYPLENTNELQYRCGGSLISDRWAMTAAHCINPLKPPTMVRLGQLKLNETTKDGVNVKIAEVIRHPLFNSQTMINDIALIRLDRSVEADFNDFLHPACLHSNVSDIDESQQLFVTGWGAVDFQTGIRSNILLKTNVTALSSASCNNTFRDLHAGQLCAHDPSARNDACQGDSGGPLQIVDEANMSTVVGIVSFGMACGTALPAVYARVAAYLSWMEPIVWPNA